MKYNFHEMFFALENFFGKFHHDLLATLISMNHDVVQKISVHLIRLDE